MPRVKDPNRPKKSPLDGYRTYDPAVEGYGDAGQWAQAFKFRMGFKEATERCAKKGSPRSILGVSLSATWNEIKNAYRKLVVEFYPEERNGEWHGDKEKFLDVQAAYEMLQREFGK